MSNDFDKDIKKVLKGITIKVLGSGGAGNNTINRLSEMKLRDIELVAVNTDAQDLLHTNATKKILIGKETTRGLGAGSSPELGEKSAEENAAQIRKELEGTDVVFVTGGLGGGTGTGSIPVISKIAKEANVLTVAVVTLPFMMEGRRRMKNAISGLKKLVKAVDTILVIPNDKLLELAPDLPLLSAFKVADEVISNAIIGIIDLVTKEGLINLDLADLKSVLQNKGYAMIGVGESDSKNRSDEAANSALHNPLLDVDVSNADAALINIIGPKDMSLSEASNAVRIVSESLDEEANVIWGAIVDDSLKNKMKVMIVVAGIKEDLVSKYESQYLLGEKPTKDEVDIDFIA